MTRQGQPAAACGRTALAPGATGRAMRTKFAGCYHGHADALLVGAGSGVATLGIPGSPGVPEAFARLTIQAPYNDLAAVAEAFARYGREIACVDPKTGAIAIVQVQTADDQEPGRTVFDDAIASSLDWGPNGIVASVGRENGGSSLYLIDPTGVDP